MPTFTGWAGWTNNAAGIILRDAALLTMTTYCAARELTGELTPVGGLLLEIGLLVAGLEGREATHQGTVYASMAAAYTVDTSAHLNGLWGAWFGAYHDSMAGGFSIKM